MNRSDGALTVSLRQGKKGGPAQTRWFFRRTVAAVLCMVLAVLLLSTGISADMGPKASTRIRFEGLEGQRYMATLLSPEPFCGPYTALEEFPDNPRYTPEDPEYPIWKKFVAFEGPDGWYFLQYFQDCTETSSFTWGYFPPARFKLLLYFPEQDAFVVSAESYERYAFDSLFTADLHDLSLSPGETKIGEFSMQRSYCYLWQIVSFFCRMAATVAIELVVAVLFCYRARQQIRIVLAANLVTQGLLNLLLNLTAYHAGGLLLMVEYVLLEFLVFLLEATAYAFLLPRYRPAGEPARRWLAVIYALVANGVSFAAGAAILIVTPGFLLPVPF